MTNEQRCQKLIPGPWRSYPCPKPARFLVIANGGRQMVVCGTHANVMRRRHTDAHISALEKTP